MRAHALPLQILLAIALVLNGIGGAMAGVLVGLPMHGVASAKVEATVELSAQSDDCADHADADAVAVAVAAEAEAHAPASTSDCHCADGSDCSDSPQCRQACMHASLAVAPAVPCAVIRPRADASLHRLAAGHPAPPLPSPIRPPIA
ncbi:CopL family metal-binding regulatory protein [Luteimonas changyuni]|uniref:CopL family metal-binding regulatory protein n=1 Tax=Luteimonas sp. MJ145 TaxID=3129234 RepID=UPI0031B9B853